MSLAPAKPIGDLVILDALLRFGHARAKRFQAGGDFRATLVGGVGMHRVDFVDVGARRRIRELGGARGIAARYRDVEHESALGTLDLKALAERARRRGDGILVIPVG